MPKGANLFILDILKEGRVLYDDGFLKEACKIGESNRKIRSNHADLSMGRGSLR